MAYVGAYGMPGVQGEHRTVGGVCSQPSGGVHAQTDMLDGRVCVWAS